MKIEDVQLKQIAISSPPILAEAIGYPGCSRYVAFYWTPYGDEVMYSDGRISADGHWHAWLLFIRHKSIAPHLQGYNLGSSDEEATHWLLVDRETCRMYVGTPGEVYPVIRGQFAEQNQAHEAQRNDTPGENTLEDFRSFVESFVEVSGPKPEEIINAMRKQDALVEELRVWLVTNLSPESS